MRMIITLVVFFFSSLAFSDAGKWKQHACDTVFFVQEDWDEKALNKEENVEKRLEAIAALSCKYFPVNVKVKLPKTRRFFHHDPGLSESEEVVRRYLSNINIEELENMSDKGLVNFINTMSKYQVPIRWVDNQKKKHKHTMETNGAAALALGLGTKGKLELVSRMMVLAPSSILPIFDGELAVLADFNFLAYTLLESVKHIDSVNIVDAVLANSHLVAYYMRFWSGGKHQNLSPLMLQLIAKMVELTQGGQSHYSLNPRQKGMLIGMMLSGALHFSKEIKSEDERKIWIVQTATNLGWAATALFGAIPIAGTGLALLTGIPSMALVLAGAIYSKNGPHDESPSIKSIEGNIELKLLQSIPLDSEDLRNDALLLLKSMSAVIHANGFGD